MVNIRLAVEADVLALQAQVAALIAGGGSTATGTVMSMKRVSSTVWEARPTNNSEIVVLVIGADPSPSLVTSGTAGMYAGDVRIVT